MKTIKSIGKLIFAIAISEFVGFLGAIFTTPAITSWYTTLVRPPIAPPNWLFAPVWTILFALMGIALFLVWNKGLKNNDTKIAYQVFGAQLILNLMWSVLFFGLHSPRGAVIEIVSLWLTILATIIAFFKISRTAAYLLIPYIAWVSFAAVLNYYFWVLN